MATTLDVYPSLRAALGSKQDSDPYNRPFGESSPIWTVYAEEAKKVDDVLVNEWNRGLDTLALFAGLFSAVTSAFILESYKLMQPDFTELTFSVLSANINGQTFVDKPFTFSGSARGVNIMWLISLIFSLSAALIAIMGKDWIAAYRVPAKQKAHEWAQLRQFRSDAVRRWRMAEVIALAPILLHASLILFLFGLALFLLPVDTITSSVVFAISAITVMFYVVTFCSPLVYSSSPFRSAWTPAMRRFVHKLHMRAAHTFRESVTSTISIRAWITRIRSSGVQSQYFMLYFALGLQGGVYNCSRALINGSSKVKSWTSRIVYGIRDLPRFVYRSFATSIKSDRWHDIPLQPPLARTVAEVIAWFSESTPSPASFYATVHALKDAEYGKEISSFVTSDVRMWYLTGTGLVNSEDVTLSDVARIYVAGLNLELHKEKMLQPYSDRLDACLTGSETTWPEDLLVAFCQPGKSPSPRITRLVAEQRSLHLPTLIRVLDHLQRDSGLAVQQRVATLITLMQYLSAYSVFGDVKSQVAELFNKDTYTSRETFHCNKTVCVMINYLCTYLRNPSRFSLDDTVILSARKTLLTLLSHHDQDCYGIPLLAHLFAFPGRSHPVWTGQYWRFDDVYAIVRRIPESALSSLDEHSASDPMLDEAIATTLSRFMSHSLPWTASDEVAVAQRCCCILRSFIPSPSVTNTMNDNRQRACRLLNKMLQNSALHALRNSMILVWLLRDIALLVLSETDPTCSDPACTDPTSTDLACTRSTCTDPACTETIRLLHLLLDGRTQIVDDGVPTWHLAEILPSLLASNTRCGASLLDALARLRKIHPEHKAWVDIERAAREVGSSQSADWVGFTSQFWSDIGFIIPHHIHDIHSESIVHRQASLSVGTTAHELLLE